MSDRSESEEMIECHICKGKGKVRVELKHCWVDYWDHTPILRFKALVSTAVWRTHKPTLVVCPLCVGKGVISIVLRSAYLLVHGHEYINFFSELYSIRRMVEPRSVRAGYAPARCRVAIWKFETSNHIKRLKGE